MKKVLFAEMRAWQGNLPPHQELQEEGRYTTACTFVALLVENCISSFYLPSFSAPKQAIVYETITRDTQRLLGMLVCVVDIDFVKPRKLSFRMQVTRQ